MRKDADGGGFIINCVNLACASNGGDNYSALKTDAEVECCIRDLKRVIFSNYCPTDAAAKEKV